MAPELIKILNSIILRYHNTTEQPNCLPSLAGTTNGAGKPGNRWEGYTGVWVQALSEVVIRPELAHFVS